MADEVKNLVQTDALQKAGEVIPLRPKTERQRTVVEQYAEIRKGKSRDVLTTAAARGPRGVKTSERDKFITRLGYDAAEIPGVEATFARHNELTQNGFDRMSDVDKRLWVADMTNAVNNSSLQEVFARIPAGEQRAALENMLKDPEFVAIYDGQLKDVAASNLVLSKADITARVNLLRARGVTPPAGVSIRNFARQELLSEFRGQATADLNDVMGKAVGEWHKQGIDAANETATADLDGVVANKVSEALKTRLNRALDSRNPDSFMPNGSVMDNFDRFMNNGLDGLLTADERQEINKNPQLKKDLEAKVGKRLFAARLNVRKRPMKQGDFDAVANAEWLGDSPEERLETVRNTLESHQGFKDEFRRAQDAGIVDKQFWQKAKELALKGALPGGIAGLIAILLGLWATPIPLAVGVLGTAGASIGGAYAKFRHGEAQSMRRYTPAA